MSEILRAEFELHYGRSRVTDYGEALDLQRLPPDGEGRRPYRSMVTEYAWRAFVHGRLGGKHVVEEQLHDPNEERPEVLWCAIHRLRSLLAGPPEHDTWYDAACHYKLKYVRLVSELKRRGIEHD